MSCASAHCGWAESMLGCPAAGLQGAVNAHCVLPNFLHAARYWPLVPDGKGYLSANQDSDVKSDRIESSYVKKKVVQNISQDAYVLF